MSTEDAGERRRKMAGLGVLAAVVMSGIGVAAAVGANEPDPFVPRSTDLGGTPVQFAATAGASPTTLPTSEAVKKVVVGLGTASPVEGLSITPGADGSQIRVAMKENDDGVLDVWYAAVAVGAVTEMTRIDQASFNKAVASDVAIGPNAEGVPTTSDLGVGAVALGQKFESPSDADLRDRVAEAARRFGLEVASVEILHPCESALRVTLIVPGDAAVAWTMDQLVDALAGKPRDVEGLMVELRAADGTPLLRSAGAYRTGQGQLWFAPGQDVRFGAGHGSLPLTSRS